MWFVKVNQIDCDVAKIQDAKELKCAAWAMHPIGKRDIPHYHFILDLSYKDAESVNKRVRALLLNPKTTSLKSTPLLIIKPLDPHPYQPIIEYMKRFMTCKDVWPDVAFWINTDRIPDYPPGFLKGKIEQDKYNKLKFPKISESQNTPLQTPPLLPKIITIKPPKKPTQRDIIAGLWDEIQQNIDSGFLNQGDRVQMTKFIFRAFVQKCRKEKLKFDRYQIIQYMNPLMCEFTNGYEDDLQNQVVEHFCSSK